MRRYHPEVECFFDSDSAGQKAALRLLPLALKAAIEVRFLGRAARPRSTPICCSLKRGWRAYESLKRGAQSAMRLRLHRRAAP